MQILFHTKIFARPEFISFGWSGSECGWKENDIQSNPNSKNPNIRPAVHLCHLANLWNRITTKIFDICRIITSKQKKFSQSDPVLIHHFRKKLQSDPILIRPKLALVLIQSDPVLILAHLCYPVCRLDIRQDSEFATESGYQTTAFKWEPVSSEISDLCEISDLVRKFARLVKRNFWPLQNFWPILACLFVKLKV